MEGRVHSIQSLGTLDGPGVRFVVFMQGCPLRCGCCHNPDTWALDGGTLYTATALADKAVRYREYFGNEGGVTLSGGEPLLQASFANAFFAACHDRDINTCLDTSGCVLNDDVRCLLDTTDRVLLDIKYPTDVLYREYVGCSIERPLSFLEELEKRRIPTVLRQVVIPTLNDNEDSIAFLRDLRRRFACVDGVELLPFKKICKVKYDDMQLPFAFEHLPTPDAESMARLQKALLLD